MQPTQTTTTQGPKMTVRQSRPHENLTIILLVLVAVVGVPYMWVKAPWRTTTKVTITCIWVSAFFAIGIANELARLNT
jgi:hypothetical protein